jgi:dihydroorotase
VTVVVDQPNTVPPILNPEAMISRINDAQENSFCHFAVNSGVSAGTDIGAMWRTGAMAFGELFYAPSSYGGTIGSDVMQSVLMEARRLNALATIHAEELSDGADTDLSAHDRLRSRQGEARAVQAIGELLSPPARLHFCHMSTAESVRLAKRFGSVEVTPHHLFLSRDRFAPGSPRGKVNPPLRNERMRKGVWGSWETIDVIASDHAPHTIREKSEEFMRAPSGIPGVETMVPLLLAAVLERKITLASVIAKTSATPAALLGIPEAGFAVGNRADFALYPKEGVPVDPDHLHSKCGWSPFEGFTAVFPSEVIMDGVSVYKEGEFSRIPARWFPGRGYIGEKRNE